MFLLQKEKSGYTHSGLINLDLFEVRQIFSFMDYIKGGTQLQCSIAIDFTGLSLLLSVSYLGPVAAGDLKFRGLHIFNDNNSH